MARQLPKWAGKRWASAKPMTRALERELRASLQAKSDLEHMKPGKACFSIVFYLPSDNLSGKPSIILIPDRINSCFIFNLT
jgi:hypothetical protein